jgi:aromatic ring-opening dioxygenase catalytic subunit (LigB family)
MLAARDGKNQFYETCLAVNRWVADRAPDLMILVFSDHLDTLNYFQNPTLAIGVAEEFPRLARDSESDSQRAEANAFKGNADLAWQLAERLIDAEFDMTVCQDLAVDHGVANGLDMITDTESCPPIIPILINSYLAPLPSPRRCYNLGRALGEALSSMKGARRALVVATGGLSHNLAGPGFGFVNPEWDHRFLNLLCDEPTTIAAMSNMDIAERGGDAGLEVRNWLTMRGSLSPAARCMHKAYFAPSLTGLGILALEDLR